MPLQIRRGTNAERLTLTPSAGLVAGELIFVTDQQRLYIGTGVTGQHQGISVTSFTADDAKDAAAEALVNGTHTGINFTYNSGTSTINAVVTGGGGVIEGSTYKIDIASDDNSTLILNSATGSINAFGGISGNLTGNVKAVDTTTIIDSVAKTVRAVTGYLTNIDGGSGSVVVTAQGISLQPTSGAVYVGSSLNSVDGNLIIIKNTFTGAVSSGLLIQGSHSTSGTDGMKFFRSRGTPAALTAVQTSDILGATSYWGYDGTTSIFSGATYSLVDSSPASGIISSTFVFDSVDSTGSRAIRARLTSGGSFRVGPSAGTDAGTGNLEIFSTVNAGTSVAGQPIRISQYFDGADSASIIATRSRGTRATPTAIQTGDTLIKLIASGNDGSVSKQSSRIKFEVEGTVSAGIVPGKISFATSDSTGAIVDRMAINSTGVISANGPVKFPVYADSTARDAAIATPEAGMVVFLTDNGSAVPKLQIYTGAAWVDLH